jgi:hypothetical protein
MAPLLESDRRALLAQYSAAYDRCQADYDTSVRTLAAGGVAVSASLVTAMHHTSNVGSAAISAFGLSLASNVISYLVAQHDLSARIVEVRGGAFAEGTPWTIWTTRLNYVAGAALIAGAAFLGWFVVSTT